MRIRVSPFFCLLITIAAQATDSDRLITTIGVGVNPIDIAITPNNWFAYVGNSNLNTNAGYDTVTVLNLRTNTVQITISDPSFSGIDSVTMNAAGTLVYVTNALNNTVSIINVASKVLCKSLVTGASPVELAITSDGQRAYVANYNADTVSVLTISDNM